MGYPRRWSFQETGGMDAYSNTYSQSSQVFELPAEPVAQRFELSARLSPPLDLLALKTEATLREPFVQPDWQYLLFAHNNNNAEITMEDEQQEPVSPLSSSSDCLSPNHTGSCFTRDPVPPQLSKKPRYYSHALSHEDKQALIEGQKNHNLKKWDAEDLFLHHASRKALLPRSMDKLEKINTLASIEQYKRQSQQAVLQAADKVGYFTKLPWIYKAADTAMVRESTYTQPQRLSQSMYDLRLSDASVPNLELLPPTPNLGSPPQANRTHIRAASSGPTLSGPAHLRMSKPPSGHTSGSSNRVRSPLAKEVPQFLHNPEVTFDSFLVPHKTGKGETHWESQNVKQLKTVKSPGVSPENGGSKALKRLSKMPSLPNLRKRFSRVESVQSE